MVTAAAMRTHPAFCVPGGRREKKLIYLCLALPQRGPGPGARSGDVAKCAASGQLGLGKSPSSAQDKPASAYGATISATAASASGLSITHLQGNTARD